MVDRCVEPFDLAAENTIRNTDTANGPPNESGRFVTKMNIGPRCFRVCSLAASDADVEDAGYSPPVPKPVTPRAIVSIQNMPSMVLPEEAVARIPPTTIIAVVVTIAIFLPR